MGTTHAPDPGEAAAFREFRAAQDAWRRAVDTHHARFEDALHSGRPYDTEQAWKEAQEIKRLFATLEEKLRTLLETRSG